MKAQTNLRPFFWVIFIAIAVVSCKSGTKNSTKTSDQGIESLVSREKVIEEVTGYPIPTSFEVTTMINDAGSPFIIGLVNSTENIDKYFSIKEKAVNLGIYSADLSYVATYIQKQKTMYYLETSKRLIDELEITSAFNRNYIQRVESNIDNRDSLIHIISESFYDTYKYLRKNEQDITSVLVVSGSWIESIYITSQIIIVSHDKQPYIDILVKQKKSLDQLLDVVEPVKDDENIRDIYSGLVGIKNAYEEIGEKATTKQIDDLTKKLETLRDGLI
jgi:hypothetical protein